MFFVLHSRFIIFRYNLFIYFILNLIVENKEDHFKQDETERKKEKKKNMIVGDI